MYIYALVFVVASMDNSEHALWHFTKYYTVSA